MKIMGKIRSNPIAATAIRKLAVAVALAEKRMLPSTMLRFQTATLATIALEMMSTTKTK